MMDTLSDLSNVILENYRNPLWWRNSVLIPQIVRPVHSRYSTVPSGRNILNEDWDNILILDACRADLFEEVADINVFDSYSTIFSQGSATPEWLRKNFSAEDHGDIVYVSGNPWVSKVVPDSFHDLEEVWRKSFNHEFGTVLPESVVSAAQDAAEKYPKKRLIVHFVQPHHPFIEVDEDISYNWIDGVTSDSDDPDGPTDPWEALEVGELSKRYVWKEYAANLKYVLDSALKLAQQLDGKSVLTSDHGNMLGERAWPVPLKIYGHPEGVRSPELTEVPWAVIEDDNRRDIEDGEVTETRGLDTETVHERLKSLGYK